MNGSLVTAVYHRPDGLQFQLTSLDFIFNELSVILERRI